MPSHQDSTNLGITRGFVLKIDDEWGSPIYLFLERRVVILFGPAVFRLMFRGTCGYRCQGSAAAEICGLAAARRILGTEARSKDGESQPHISRNTSGTFNQASVVTLTSTKLSVTRRESED